MARPTSRTCPQCGGSLEAVTIGSMHDKQLRCAHCDHLIDVPDEFEVTQTREGRTPGGGHRRVSTTVRRADLDGGAPGPTPEQLDLEHRDVEVSVEGVDFDGSFEDLERMIHETFGVTLSELESGGSAGPGGGTVHEVRTVVEHRDAPEPKTANRELRVEHRVGTTLSIDQAKALKIAVAIIVLLLLYIAVA